MAFTLNAARPLVGRTGMGLRMISTSRPLAIRTTLPTLRAAAATIPDQAQEGISADDTAGFKYVPGGPILKGTVNDATSFPHSDPSHGSRHWIFERALSAALVPIMGAAVVVSPGTGVYPILDAVLCTSLIIHSHIGFDSVLVDYLHPRKFPVLGKISSWALRVATGLSIWGVYEFETNDIGLTELIRKLWKNRS